MSKNFYLYRIAYDLATDSSNQKHSIKKYGDKKCGNYFLPRSRPSSRQSNDSLDELEVVAQSQTAVTPDLSWSRTSSQEDILKSVISSFSKCC